MNGSYKTPIGTRVPLFPLHFLGWLLLLQALSKRLSPTKITSAKRSTFINEKKASVNLLHWFLNYPLLAS
jgi:hypothetical protein